MKEYEPPVFPLRWMKYGGLLFLSGVTDMTHPTFDEQFPVIIERITGSFADGGATWKDVKRASFLPGQSFCGFHPANSGHTRFTTAPSKSHATHWPTCGGGRLRRGSGKPASFLRCLR